MKQMIFEIKFFIREKVKFIVKLPKNIRKTIKYTKIIKNIEKNEKNVFYFGVPKHTNLGDQAQCMCIENWLKNNYKDCNVVELPDDVMSFNLLGIIQLLKTKVMNENLIVFQSGYCTTDKYIISENMHRNIIKNFKDNKILFFPQTVKFYSKIEERKTIKIYNSHNNIIFLARDNQSFEMAKKMFKTAKIFLYPDIVTSLIGKYSYNSERKDILFCMRDDREQFYSKSDVEVLKTALENKYKVNTKFVDTTIDIEPIYLKENIQKVLEEEFNDFATYKLIITDRYHGTIFSLISTTPVIVLGSTDHKLISGVNWFKDVYKGKIYFAEDLKKVEKIAERIFNDPEIDYQKYDDYFDREYYSKLLKNIEE